MQADRFKQSHNTRDPVEVDGVSCNGGIFSSGIHLYENGRLQQCRLARAVTIGDVDY